jgi:hypothetical protein
MNSHFKLSTLIVTLLLSLFFTGCKDKPLSLQLSIAKASLQVDENTTLQVIALYENNISKDVTQEVEWISSHEDAVEISKNFLLTKQDTNITLQAKLKGVTSNAVALEIYKEINGHRLPPEPNPTINNSTLLGIDVNNNGVRDDVERWIFLDMKIYNGYEKIEQTIAMQEAKANQMALKDPTNKDDRVQIAINAAFDCWVWYDYIKDLPKIGNLNQFSRAIDDKSFNTKERLKTYWQYDSSLAGRVFTSTPTLKTQTQCEVSIDEL